MGRGIEKDPYIGKKVIRKLVLFSRLRVRKKQKLSNRNNVNRNTNATLHKYRIQMYT
jgi:hypothetical protein